MDALLEKLNAKLKEWKPETAAEVRNRLAEMMALADQDALDLNAIAGDGAGSFGYAR